LKPSGVFLLAIVHFLSLLAVVIVLSAMTPGDGENVRPMTVFAAGLAGPMVALYVGLRKWAPGEPTRAALRLEAPRGRELGVILLSVLAGAALAPIATELTARIVSAWPMEGIDPSADAGETGFAIVFATVGAIVIVPAAEELLYRGFALPRIAQTVGRGRAIVIVTALSTLIEIANPRFLPATLIIALPMAIVGTAGRTAWAVIAGRLAHEALPPILALCGISLPEYGTASTAATEVPVAILVVCGAVAIVALAASWRLRPRAPDQPSPS
jgi:membrane protease YdiL (CAAX protease family)